MSIVRPIARPIMESITRPITTPSTGSAWSPARLFTTSEPGIAYDLTDKTKLYQDSTRTTLVSANGDPIGSVTDLSGNGKHASQATTASKPLFQGYADFDGVDDSWATAAIDFTGTNKATVVVSATKTADRNQVLVELGPNTNITAGSFVLHFPADATPVNLVANRGAVALSGGIYSLPAGITAAVLTARYDLSLASYLSATARVNGAEITETPNASPDPGGGTFRNDVLTIGRRTSAAFTGRIYRMIVIGRTLTAAELSRAEAWCAAPAGVVLP